MIIGTGGDGGEPGWCYDTGVKYYCLPAEQEQIQTSPSPSPIPHPLFYTPHFTGLSFDDKQSVGCNYWSLCPHCIINFSFNYLK